jgi:hypothetical protein
MSSLNESASDRHFMGDPDQRLLCHIFLYSADLKHNLAGPDSGNPKFGLTFTFAHTRLQRLGAYRLVWKQPKIDFTFTMQKMSGCNSAGFNVLGSYPAALQSLQAVFAKCHKITPGGVTFHSAALALAKLNSLRHHCHFLRPL